MWEDNIGEWTGLEFAKSQSVVENRKKMEETGCEVICDTPTTLAVKGQVKGESEDEGGGGEQGPILTRSGRSSPLTCNTDFRVGRRASPPCTPAFPLLSYINVH